ncbi:integration host factor subunit alpha [Derxia gummosa]|uniref:Integration host factor subunit alpha n=1 Tax=Derxia gummosa DSM 723 TaxID=1121388 RepID=A0A9U5G6M9_9BURK|nr:integration host factor subunit alpha [Derxia gummosa]
MNDDQDAMQDEVIPFGRLAALESRGKGGLASPSRPVPLTGRGFTLAPQPKTSESVTLTKAELAELLFERVGLNKREAKDMVEIFFEEIARALEAGEVVKLSGFGNFQLRDKPQRPGRNPKTGEEIPITARRVVTFHASQKLKQLVDNG